VPCLPKKWPACRHRHVKGKTGTETNRKGATPGGGQTSLEGERSARHAPFPGVTGGRTKTPILWGVVVGNVESSLRGLASAPKNGRTGGRKGAGKRKSRKKKATRRLIRSGKMTRVGQEYLAAGRKKREKAHRNTGDQSGSTIPRRERSPPGPNRRRFLSELSTQ